MANHVEGTPKGIFEPKEWSRLDFRSNLMVDRDNPLLILKAWRSNEPSGEAHLGVRYGEDALTWNVFRTLQDGGDLDIAAQYLDLEDEIEDVLFWGCDPKGESSRQQTLNCLIRGLDGIDGGTLTEPDLVVITRREVCFVECKGIASTRFPWKAQKPKTAGADKIQKERGWMKRWATYARCLPWVEPLSSEKRRAEVARFYQLARNAIYSRLMMEALGKEIWLVGTIMPTRNYVRFQDEFEEVYSDFATWCGPNHVRKMRFWEDLLEYHLPPGLAKKIREALRSPREN